MTDHRIEMTTQPEKPSTDAAKAARIRLIMAIAGSVIGIFFMFTTLTTNAAIIGTAALLTADAFIFFAVKRAQQNKR